VLVPLVIGNVTSVNSVEMLVKCGQVTVRGDWAITATAFVFSHPLPKQLPRRQYVSNHRARRNTCRVQRQRMMCRISWGVNSGKANQIPPFVEPEGSLPYSQEPASGPDSQRYVSSLHHHTLIFLNLSFNIILSFMLISANRFIYLFIYWRSL
jgi:hypothetical protein